MTRVILAHNLAQIDSPATGTRYGGNTPGRVFDMDPADARAVVKAGGALASLAGAARRRDGYRCGRCGFGSFLRTCSRCGGACERE